MAIFGKIIANEHCKNYCFKTKKKTHGNEKGKNLILLKKKNTQGKAKGRNNSFGKIMW